MRYAVPKRLSIVIIVLIVVAGVAGDYYYLRAHASSQTELRVFAAASLTPALQDLKPSFDKNYSSNLIFNLAGSNILSQQILQGSPADVFISANLQEIQRVRDASLLADSNRYSVLAYNYLAVFVPADNPKRISSLGDLLKPGVRVVTEDKSVPAGAYTLQVWQRVDSTWGNTSSPLFKGPQYVNYSSKIRSHIVSYESDVESALQKVVTGAADAGFAYTSDIVPQGTKALVIQIPGEINIKATYPIGIISTSKHPELAHEFVRFMLSSEGQALLKKWGFIPAVSS